MIKIQNKIQKPARPREIEEIEESARDFRNHYWNNRKVPGSHIIG